MMKTTGRGFSLVEVLVVVALISIGSAVALVQMRSSMQILDADRACDLVMTQLRYARQIAVDQRRNVLVEFLGNNEMKATRQDGGGVTTVIYDVTLPAGFTFSMPMGVADTPDGYSPGVTAAVYFNGETSGTFLGDGVFVNGAGNLLNGAVFTMGGSGSTARAVTLNGASGRTKTYTLNAGTWTER